MILDAVLTREASERMDWMLRLLYPAYMDKSYLRHDLFLDLGEKIYAELNCNGRMSIGREDSPIYNDNCSFFDLEAYPRGGSRELITHHLLVSEDTYEIFTGYLMEDTIASRSGRLSHIIVLMTNIISIMGSTNNVLVLNHNDKSRKKFLYGIMVDDNYEKNKEVIRDTFGDRLIECRFFVC